MASDVRKPLAGLPRSQKQLVQGRLTEADYVALGAFRKAMREFLAFSEESARLEGMTSQQHQAILAIRSHRGDEPMTIGDLADCLMIKHHTAVELVGRLTSAGLVERSQSSSDRRRVLLHLTPPALQAIEAISVRNFGQLAETQQILSELTDRVRGLEKGRANAQR